MCVPVFYLSLLCILTCTLYIVIVSTFKSSIINHYEKIVYYSLCFYSLFFFLEIIHKLVYIYLLYITIMCLCLRCAVGI